MRKHLIVALGTFLLVFSVAGPARAAWFIDRTGTLIQVDGSVLGDDNTKVEVEPVEVKDSKDVKSNDQERVESRDGEVATKEKQALTVEKKLKELEAIKESAKKKLELEIKNREKLQELRKEKIKSKIESNGDKLKLRQEVLNAEGEKIKENEVEIVDQEGIKVEQEDGKNLEIKADKQNHVRLTKDNIHANTDLPISIGENNELIITRPDGTEKVVTILPDKAVDRIREKGAEPTSEATLDIEGDMPVYKFSTEEKKKLFGLFNLTVNKDVAVSADDGSTVSEQINGSIFTRLFARFAK